MQQILTERLIKPNKLQTGLFQPLKVSLNFSVLKLFNIKLELSTEKLKQDQFLFCLIFRLPRTIASDIVRFSRRI